MPQGSLLHKKTIQELRLKINSQKLNKIKYLNQKLERKKQTIARLFAKNKEVKKNLSDNALGREVKNIKRRNSRLKEKTKHSVPSREYAKLKQALVEKNDQIKSLESDKLELEDMLEEVNNKENISAACNTKKDKKTYGMQTRMMPSLTRSQHKTSQFSLRSFRSGWE